MNSTGAGMFIGDWSSKEEMISEFEGIYSDKDKTAETMLLPKYQDINILLACYTTGSYDGQAFVLYEKDGQLYEVNAGHCSCYGLEDQWDPEITTPEALHKRFFEGYQSSDEDELREKLKPILEAYNARTSV